MSVNDLILQGAEPLPLLNYYDTSKLDVKVAADVIKGIADSCIQVGCALIGGETTEMPGMYAEGELDSPGIFTNTSYRIFPLGDYHLADFAVGAVRHSLLLPNPDMIRPGDVLLGVSSPGLPLNRFSLVREVIQKAGLTFSSLCPRTVPGTNPQGGRGPDAVGEGPNDDLRSSNFFRFADQKSVPQRAHPYTFGWL